LCGEDASPQAEGTRRADPPVWSTHAFSPDREVRTASKQQIVEHSDSPTARWRRKTENTSPRRYVRGARNGVACWRRRRQQSRRTLTLDPLLTGWIGFLLLPKPSFVPLIQAKAKTGGSKKPLTGFMLFSKEHREKVKEENPGIAFGQIGKKLGEMWRGLSDAEKQAYKDGKKTAAK